MQPDALARVHKSMKKKFIATLLVIGGIVVINTVAGGLLRKSQGGAYNPSDQAVISAAGGSVRRNRTTGSRESLRQLLDGGANPDARDASSKDTALIVATRSGPVKSVEVLLAHGADVKATGMFDRTAMHYAALYGNLAKTKALVAAGADINARSAVGEKPLPLARKFHRQDVIAFLQSVGAKG